MSDDDVIDLYEAAANLAPHPITGQEGGHSVLADYVSELKGVTTAEELRAFTTKWAQVWDIDYPARQEPLGLGEYDADEALACIAASREDVCKHAGDHEVTRADFCTGMRIVMPETFLVTRLYAEKLGAPYNLVLRRLIDTAREKETRH